MAQVDEIFPCRRQGYIYRIQSILWLLMTTWHRSRAEIILALFSKNILNFEPEGLNIFSEEDYLNFNSWLRSAIVIGLVGNKPSPITITFIVIDQFVTSVSYVNTALGLWKNLYPVTHYSNVIMSTMASQITGVSVVCSTVCSGADQRKHQSSASLAFVRGNPLVTGGFPSKRASDMENVSIWWCHHELGCKMTPELPHISYQITVIILPTHPADCVYWGLIALN